MQESEAATSSTPIVVKQWHQIARDEFFGIARLRTEVFYVEQRIDEPDFDEFDRDEATWHFWIPDSFGCAAYLRVVELSPPELGAGRSFGRVAVRRECRGRGLARRLIGEVIDRFGKETMAIHSQDYVTALYEDYGFEAVGELYHEAGLPHRMMLRPAD